VLCQRDVMRRLVPFEGIPVLGGVASNKRGPDWSGLLLALTSAGAGPKTVPAAGPEMSQVPASQAQPHAASQASGALPAGRDEERYWEE
jgi:hypothetical protein